MNASIFWALMRKDFRLYRVAVLGMLISGAVIYLVGGTSAWMDDRTQNLGFRLVLMLERAGMIGVAATAAVATTFGGLAFAAERKERTADFVQLMPVSRAAAAISKLVVALPILATFFGLHVIAVAFGTRAEAAFHGSPESIGFLLRDDVAIIGLAVTGGVMALGFAWLASSFMTSAAISASVGGAVALLAFLVFQNYADANHHQRPDRELFAIWHAISLTSGIVALVAGTLIFVRRVEP